MCQVTGRVLADMLIILCQFQQCKSQLEERLYNLHEEIILYGLIAQHYLCLHVGIVMRQSNVSYSKNEQSS